MDICRISTVSPDIREGSVGDTTKKMLKKYDRSLNVYENK